MIGWTDQLPACTVIIPSPGETTRFSTFELCLGGLHAPNGSQLLRVQGASIAKNVNDAIRLSQTKFYFMMDDDHQFDPHVLLALMAHNLPVVVGLTVLKMPPFMPTIFASERTTAEGNTQYMPFSLGDIDGKSGLYGPIWACGRAGMLIKREVFEAIPPPWFELGKTNPEEAGEDFWFCSKLRAASIPIMCDLDVPFGHIATCAAWPYRHEDGTWAIRLEWANGTSIMINRANVKAGPVV